MAVITPDYVRNNYLWGLDIRDASGNPLPDSVLSAYIESAQDRLQRALNVQIEPRQFVEEHDYYVQDYQSWAYIDLYRRPIISIDKVEMVFTNYSVLEFNKEWVRASHGKGQIQLFPTFGALGTVMITSSGMWLPIIFRQWQYAPKLWRITYTAGFDPVPDALKELLAKMVCVNLAETFMDLVVGPNVGSQSITVDGVSQSTTAFSKHPKIEEYRRDIQLFFDQVAHSFRGIDFVVA